MFALSRPQFLGRFVAASVMLLGIFSVAGCGSSDTLVKVTGKVTLNKQPLSSGSVAFIGDVFAGSSMIGSDGKYEIAGVPAGKALAITVSAGSGPMPGMMGPKGPSGPPKGVDTSKMLPPEPKGKATRISPKYADAKSSGLSYTPTQAAEQTHDIDLAP
ncbi:hypothetical protein [Tuwongella immobilis]|nr:hypothetical protein [Tuwongella immobilis]